MLLLRLMKISNNFFPLQKDNSHLLGIFNNTYNAKEGGGVNKTEQKIQFNSQYSHLPLLSSVISSAAKIFSSSQVGISEANC